MKKCEIDFKPLRMKCVVSLKHDQNALAMTLKPQRATRNKFVITYEKIRKRHELENLDFIFSSQISNRRHSHIKSQTLDKVFESCRR